jgi:hypothetical protein
MAPLGARDVAVSSQYSVASVREGLVIEGLVIEGLVREGLVRKMTTWPKSCACGYAETCCGAEIRRKYVRSRKDVSRSPYCKNVGASPKGITDQWVHDAQFKVASVRYQVQPPNSSMTQQCLNWAL